MPSFGSSVSVDDLKKLPLNDIADEEGCVILSWASGITIQKVIDLT